MKGVFVFTIFGSSRFLCSTILKNFGEEGIVLFFFPSFCSVAAESEKEMEVFLQMVVSGSTSF